MAEKQKTREGKTYELRRSATRAAKEDGLKQGEFEIREKKQGKKVVYYYERTAKPGQNVEQDLASDDGPDDGHPGEVEGDGTETDTEEDAPDPEPQRIADEPLPAAEQKQEASGDAVGKPVEPGYSQDEQGVVTLHGDLRQGEVLQAPPPAEMRKQLEPEPEVASLEARGEIKADSPRPEVVQLVNSSVTKEELAAEEGQVPAEGYRPMTAKELYEHDLREASKKRQEAPPEPPKPAPQVPPWKPVVPSATTTPAGVALQQATTGDNKIHRSRVESPTKLVWHIADEMHAKNPKTQRRDVMKECERRGIAFYTARTQYQQWLAATRESNQHAAAAPKITAQKAS